MNLPVRNFSSGMLLEAYSKIWVQLVNHSSLTRLQPTTAFQHHIALLGLLTVNKVQTDLQVGLSGICHTARAHLSSKLRCCCTRCDSLFTCCATTAAASWSCADAGCVLTAWEISRTSSGAPRCSCNADMRLQWRWSSFLRVTAVTCLSDQ